MKSQNIIFDGTLSEPEASAQSITPYNAKQLEVTLTSKVCVHVVMCVCYSVVISALRCFHDLTNKVEVGRCGSDGSAEYQRNYIRPLVEQSRETVTARCTLPSPYDQDFASGAQPIVGTYHRRRHHASDSSRPLSLICAAILFVVHHAPLLATPFLLTWVMLAPPQVPPTAPSTTTRSTKAAIRRRRPRLDAVDSQTTPGGTSIDDASRTLRWRAADVCRNSCTLNSRSDYR